MANFSPANRAEILLRLHEAFSDFQARLAGLKILARFEYTGLGFLARAELRSRLNRSPCNRQFDFKRICFRSRAEIRHVIRQRDSVMGCACARLLSPNRLKSPLERGYKVLCSF